MDKKFRFNDNVQYRVVSYNEKSLRKVQDDYMGALKPAPAGTPHPSGLGVVPDAGGPTADRLLPSGRGLVVKVAATHSGIITRNNGLYLPDRMRRAAPTWTEFYEKPVQVHHNDGADPVGRVIASRYVETVGQVQDRFRNHVLRDASKRQVGRADESFWKDFVGPGNLKSKVAKLRLIDTVLQDPHYTGLGYIELTLDITDPEAIQKIIDGRYLTGSVGAVSDAAVCSVCNSNWLEDGMCEHKPGRVYDGVKCYIVAGELEYDEWSWVNAPADRHASVQAVLQQDSHQVEDSAAHVLYFVPERSTQEVSAVKDNLKADNTVEGAIEDVESSAADVETKNVEDSTETQEVEAEVKDELSQEEKDSLDTTADEEQQVQDSVESSEPTLLDRVFVDDFSGVKFTDEEADSLYELLADELEDKDAKLSAEARKKLPKSSFCGPDRSFPVTDCAHVTAARRMLSRYKGEGSKSAISACIDRKARALGCSEGDCALPENPVKDEAQAEEVTSFSTDSFSSWIDQLDDFSSAEFSSEEVEALRMLITQVADKLGKDNFSKALAAAELTVAQDDFDAQVAETLRVEDELGTRSEQLNELRRELKAVYEDFASLQDQLVSATESARESKIAHIQTLAKFNKDHTEELESQIKLQDMAALDSTLVSYKQKFDSSKIADSFSSELELARTPSETVNDPTAATSPEPTDEGSISDNSVKSKPTYLSQKRVDDVYRYLLVTQQNPGAARDYYKAQVEAGLAKEDPTKMPR